MTTRSLLATWLTEVGRGIPRDPIEALRAPDFYTFAINTQSAVYRYATIPVAGASRLGIVAAMLVIRAQDTGPLTPDQVIVSVVRGSRVFIVTAPAAAMIHPPPAFPCCSGFDHRVVGCTKRGVPTSEHHRTP